MIGDFGHIAIVIGFICCLSSVVLFFCSENTGKAVFTHLARFFYHFHSIALLSAAAVLFIIIKSHRFEYNYAWQHTSLDLPTHYMIASFWEGQEGSFLFWIVLNALLGSVLLFLLPKIWKNSTLSIYAMVQTVFITMVLGTTIFNVDIGVSPFRLLNEAQDFEVFKANPNYIPKDGTGLNPLLQNIWMVIHPPTIFLGFTLGLVPFSLAMAGLRKKNFTGWINIALPWTIVTTLVLGLGIAMGAYWAYETLNFGGYWSWDPVENAIYIPWVIWIALIHLMLISSKKGKAIKGTFILTISGYALIIYSTFLTRSGILGDASVHSFTDSGLFAQLAIFFLALLLGSFLFYGLKSKYIPQNEEQFSVNNYQLWITVGAATLVLAGFQVLLATSIPVINRIGSLFYASFALAPPTDPVLFYTNFQYYFALFFCIISVSAQFIYWKSNLIERRKLLLAVLASGIISIVLLNILQITNWKYIVLFIFSTATIVSSVLVIISLPNKNLFQTGGSISHIGMAVVLIGIICSGGYSRIVSLTENMDSATEAHNNILIKRGETKKLGGYNVTYKGLCLRTNDGNYVNKDIVKPSFKPGQFIVTEDTDIYNKGDKLFCELQNLFYELSYQSGGDIIFSLFPRIQFNASMGIMASPAIKSSFQRDIYTHVSNFPDPTATDYLFKETFVLGIHDSIRIEDYLIKLHSIESAKDIIGVYLESGDSAFVATLNVIDLNTKSTYKLQPTLLIKHTGANRIIESRQSDPKMIATLDGLNKNDFTITLAVGRRDWIVLKSMEKPFISLVWIGCGLLTFGFSISLFKRIQKHDEN